MRTCINCEKNSGCAYKYMNYVCSMWKANSNTVKLKHKAQEIVEQPMSFRERQFVISCATAEAFTDKQMHWLNSLIKRFEKTEV